MEKYAALFEHVKSVLYYIRAIRWSSLFQNMFAHVQDLFRNNIALVWMCIYIEIYMCTKWDQSLLKEYGIFQKQTAAKNIIYVYLVGPCCVQVCPMCLESY